MNIPHAKKYARPISKGLVVATLFFSLLPGIALADDWVAERLRGRVFVQTDGVWVLLDRGDVVSDHSPIQSIASGRATFTRGNESIEIGGDTIIQIIDLGTGGLSNTLVRQQVGTVTVEAEVQQVEHFRVETPFLAAVVKGTRFTVHADGAGAEVLVDRGRVEVNDEANQLRTEITPGQSAGNLNGSRLTVRGPGPHQPVTSTGPGASPGPDSVSTIPAGAGDGNGNSGNGNGNNGNGNGNSGNNGNGNGNGNNGNGSGNGGGINVSVGGGNGNNGNSGNNGNGKGHGVNVSVGGGNGVGVNVNVGGLGLGK